MIFKSDDICPNGFNCTKDHSSCGRLHTVIRDHVCPHIDVETMCCQHRDCRLVHLPLLKIRDRILSVILWIYARRCREGDNLRLKDMVISDDDLVGCYFEIYGAAPIPNMTQRQWKWVVDRYKKYHIDYHQQRQLVETDGDAPFHSLWRTTFVSKDRRDGHWNLSMIKGYRFIIARICRMWMDPDRRCRNTPSFQCPFFHLDRKCVALAVQCRECNVERPRFCARWHFNQSDRRKVYILNFTFLCILHFVISVNMNSSIFAFLSRDRIGGERRSNWTTTLTAK